jgi:transcriptional regulator with XRE-family HTH domain
LQENIAVSLDMTQSNYARLEKDDNRISVPRLLVIAKTLDISVTELVGEKANTIVNQNTQRDAFAYFQSTFQSDKEHIQTLKDEIEYLKKMVDKFLER